MTEQEKLVKVIEGLENFIKDFKPFCGNKFDWQKVYDALALLKAQEPRVMTPEEIYDSIVNDERKCVYLQMRNGVCRKPRPAVYTNLYGTGIENRLFMAYTDITGCLEHICLYTHRYGAEWVFWTSCPTDVQREAIPWP